MLEGEEIPGAGYREGTQRDDDKTAHRQAESDVTQRPEAETDGEGRQRQQIAIQREDPVAEGKRGRQDSKPLPEPDREH